MKVLSIVSGFITNSSSVIHGFDASILEDGRILTILAKYGVANGFVGDYMWNRASCSSVIITEDQRKEATEKFKDTEYSSFDPGFKEGVVYVIFGDEYDGLAQEINQIMEQIAEEKKIPRVYRSDFN